MGSSARLASPLAALLLGAPALAGAVVGTLAEVAEAKVRLVSRWAVAPAGGDAGLGLDFELAPGWHVYWRNSGDAGYPPRLELAGAAGLGPARLRYPAPRRFELPGGLVSFGYQETVVYPIDAELAADAPARVAVAARLDYLVCAGECIPHRAELALELPVGAAAEDGAVAPRLDAWRARLPRAAAELAPPVALEARWTPGEYPWSTLELRFAGGGLRAAAPDLFFAPQSLVELGRPVFAAAATGPLFRVPVRPLDETRPLPASLALDWTATGFETPAGALALEGTVAVAPGVSRGARRLGPWLAAALAAAALLVYVVVRHRSTRTGG
jgi:suppressor for copper-sensitivity B